MCCTASIKNQTNVFYIAYARSAIICRKRNKSGKVWCLYTYIASSLNGVWHRDTSVG